MRIVVAGGRGQLGRALARRGAVALGREELDVTQPIGRLDADVVINCAAYTAVDRAESERDVAFAVNATGAGNLARACALAGIRLLHVSTDYVFDGTSLTPYVEDAPLAPINVYGASKAAGEREVHAAGGTVVRTSWLFGEGGPSFVHTIRRLARERSVLRVVADQHGCPTWTDDLADALVALAALPSLAPTYHACNAGPTTWFDFARRIVAGTGVTVEPITTADYPTPARRPVHSVLDTSRLAALGITLPSWEHGLTEVLRT